MGCCIIGALILSTWISRLNAVRRLLATVAKSLFPFTRIASRAANIADPAPRVRRWLAAALVAEGTIVAAAVIYGTVLGSAHVGHLWSHVQDLVSPTADEIAAGICRHIADPSLQSSGIAAPTMHP
jgi:hypothetical protein